MRIVLLGAPGAGKGTQCKKIVDRFGLLHLSSGDILRQNRAEGTDLGKKAQQYMDEGVLVPDGLIIEMMGKAIDGAPESGFVLDGFPRTVNQAEKLDKYLKEHDCTIDKVVELVVPDDLVVDRITGRRSCPVCGAVYHIENMKPAVAGKCDNDGAELVGRPDDTCEVVQNRLDTYHEMTEPVKGYYSQAGLVVEVAADDAPELVTQKVFEILDLL
jgi:adenylate kinase